MTEPTAEQVDAERERAHAVMAQVYRQFGIGVFEMAFIQEVVATALARVRIEALAAGRDEGLEQALTAYLNSTSDLDVVSAIRALRGRT